MLYILPTDTCFGLACSIEDIEGKKMIYEVKGRDFNKPLAIMINDFSFIENVLNKKQIEFLISYDRPWTILIKKDKINDSKFIDNSLEYIAFRLANNEIEENLINEIGPIYLTSANISGKGENYEIEKLKKDFAFYLGDIKILAIKDLPIHTSPSDIFEFIGDTTEISYLRKN